MPIQEARTLLESLVVLHTQRELPGILTAPERIWECEWCPARGKCEEMHGGPVGKAALESKEETREEP